MAGIKKVKAPLREQKGLSGASATNNCEVIMPATSTKVNIQPTHRCSFCGKTNVEVAGALIVGDGVSICQECVLLCVEIVFKNSARTDEPTAS